MANSSGGTKLAAGRRYKSKEEDDDGQPMVTTVAASSPQSGYMPLSQDNQIVVLRIVLAGGPSVGKTALVEQFVNLYFPEEYVCTRRRKFYYPSVVLNGHLYELRIIDCPPMYYFPPAPSADHLQYSGFGSGSGPGGGGSAGGGSGWGSSGNAIGYGGSSNCGLVEWNEARQCAVRHCTAYVFVYDASRDESFQYVKLIREQLLESRGDTHDIPIVVAANKWDLCTGGGPYGACGQVSSGGSVGGILVSSGGGPGPTVMVAPPEDHASSRTNGRARRDIAQLVKKSWKIPHIECSAKTNWHVVLIFKELVRLMHQLEHKPNALGLHDAFRTRKCNIL